MYAIGQLITQVIGVDKKKKFDVVEKMGYKNMSKGYSRLNELIKTGQCSWELHKKLPDALGVEPSIVDEAFQDTYKQIQKEEEARKREEEARARATFKPHIFIEHEKSVPDSITLVSLTGVDCWKIINLPDITDKNFTEQVRIVRQAILKNEQKQKRKPFGNATYYIYRNTFDTSVKFSVDGSVVDRNYKWHGVYPEASLEVGGQVITGGIIEPCDVC